MDLCVEVGGDGVPFIQLNKHILRLDLEDIDEEYKEKARKELRETPENVAAALSELREMLQGEEGLNLPLEDDQFLIKFLRPCKFYASSTFNRMKKYYKFKEKNPKYGQNLLPRVVQHVLASDMALFLPVRTPDGSRIMVANLGTNWDPKKVKVEDMFKAIIMALEIAMIEPKTQVAGVHLILNLEGLSLIHYIQVTPRLAKTAVDFIQECTPTRLKGIHVINQPRIFDMVYIIFKPFLGEKLKQRLFLHGSSGESLCETISAKCIPEYLGGDLDIPECPGRLLAEIWSYYDKEFELCNTLGYTKVKVQKT